MKISEKVPEYINTARIVDWEQSTPEPKGMIPIYLLMSTVKEGHNWLLLYSWCYIRTNGFRHQCMSNWDYARTNLRYETARAGIRAAYQVFQKVDDTTVLEEGKQTDELYRQICLFCEKAVYAIVEEAPEAKPQPQKPLMSRCVPPRTKFSFIGLIFSVMGLFFTDWIRAAFSALCKLFKK